jgi:hypothetical protein
VLRLHHLYVFSDGIACSLLQERPDKIILGAVMMVQRPIYQGEVAGDDSGPLNVRCLADQSREVPKFAAEHGVNYLHFAAVEVLLVSSHWNLPVVRPRTLCWR